MPILSNVTVLVIDSEGNTHTYSTHKSEIISSTKFNIPLNMLNRLNDDITQRGNPARTVFLSAVRHFLTKRLVEQTIKQNQTDQYDTIENRD